MNHLARDSGIGFDGQMPKLETEKERQDFCINILRVSWANVKPLAMKHDASFLHAALAFKIRGFEPHWIEFQLVNTPLPLIQAMLDTFRQQE